MRAEYKKFILIYSCRSIISIFLEFIYGIFFERNKLLGVR